MKNIKTFEDFSNLSAENVDEGMVQVAGKGKPAGAKILAMVIVDELEKNGMLKPGANTNNIKNDVMELIMKSTF